MHKPGGSWNYDDIFDKKCSGGRVVLYYVVVLLESSCDYAPAGVTRV